MTAVPDCAPPRRTQTRLYDSAVSALKRLARAKGSGAALAALADTVADEGVEYAAANDLKKVKRCPRNVGRLLVGIPDALYDAEPLDPDLPATAAEPVRRMVVRMRRDRIVDGIVDGEGWADHAEVFVKDGRLDRIVSHPCSLGLAELKDLVRTCEAWGLDVSITGDSWYYPGRTSRVTLCPAETDA